MKFEVNGMGLAEVLFLIFLVLKLLGIITWSWAWVTSPLWIPMGLVSIIIVIMAVGWGIRNLLDK